MSGIDAVQSKDLAPKEHPNLLNATAITTRIDRIFAVGMPEAAGQKDVGCVVQLVRREGPTTVEGFHGRRHHSEARSLRAVANGFNLAERTYYAPYVDKTFDPREFIPSMTCRLFGIDEDGNQITAGFDEYVQGDYFIRLSEGELTDKTIAFRTYFLSDLDHNGIGSIIEALPEDKPNPFTREAQQRHARTLGIPY
ncbi:MAG: hypothetical protein HYV40_03945 [Candidatus Levybacteria bacterium]|nr:hypothetical protein [Candidatus Levybacteria bacterium]